MSFLVEFVPVVTGGSTRPSALPSERSSSTFPLNSFVRSPFDLSAGLHEMSVLYHGKQVTGSPFNSLVLDPSSVVISPANQIGTVGEPLTVIGLPRTD